MMSTKSIRTEAITFPKGDIQDGLLRRFRTICPGALEIYIILRAYSSDASGIAKVPISRIRKVTGLQLNRILDILDKLKDVGIINIPMRDLPFEERAGKSFIYEIRNL